jgi:ribose transport system ATP-binding protein
VRRAPAAGQPRLALRNLSKSFGGTHALRGADLTVLPGEVHGLLGENGSGKSTLIKILAGFHEPDAGELEIDTAQRLGSTEALGEPTQRQTRRLCDLRHC